MKGGLLSVKYTGADKIVGCNYTDQRRVYRPSTETYVNPGLSVVPALCKVVVDLG